MAEAVNDAPRGDYSIAELRGLMRGEEPKPAASAEAPPAAGDKPAESGPVSGTDKAQAAAAADDKTERGTDGKFKAKDGEAKQGETKPDGEGEVPAGVQKRIDKAVRAQRDAERRADEAERKLREGQGSRPGDEQPPNNGQPGAKNAPSAAEAKPKPRPEAKDFDTYDAYMVDLTRWTIAQEREADAQKRAQDTRQAADSAAVRSHVERVEAAKKKPEMADFDEVIADAKDLPISRGMHDAIVTSEKGPEIAYQLAKNPDEARRIAALSPVRQIAELGKIEAAIEAKASADQSADKKPPAEKKPLPKPAANVGGGSGAPKEQRLDDPDIDMGTFRRLARAGLRKSA